MWRVCSEGNFCTQLDEYQNESESIQEVTKYVPRPECQNESGYSSYICWVLILLEPFVDSPNLIMLRICNKGKGKDKKDEKNKELRVVVEIGSPAFQQSMDCVDID